MTTARRGSGSASGSRSPSGISISSVSGGSVGSTRRGPAGVRASRRRALAHTAATTAPAASATRTTGQSSRYQSRGRDGGSGDAGAATGRPGILAGGGVGPVAHEPDRQQHHGQHHQQRQHPPQAQSASPPLGVVRPEQAAAGRDMTRQAAPNRKRAMNTTRIPSATARSAPDATAALDRARPAEPTIGGGHPDQDGQPGSQHRPRTAGAGPLHGEEGSAGWSGLAGAEQMAGQLENSAVARQRAPT